MQNLALTREDDGRHGQGAVEVDGSIKRDESVEKSFPAQRDEVAAYGKQHVGKQKGDASCRATSHDDAHHCGPRYTCRFGLQTII